MEVIEIVAVLLIFMLSSHVDRYIMGYILLANLISTDVLSILEGDAWPSRI
jgi:hypothetical protein